MIAAVAREFAEDYAVTFWTVVVVLGLLTVAGGFVAWGRRGGGPRG